MQSIYEGERMKIKIWLLVLFATLFACGQAQPLSGLLPAETFLTLSASQQNDIYEGMRDDLAALNWEEKKTTLIELFQYAATNTDDDIVPLIAIYEAMLTGDIRAASEEFLEICPDYESVIETSMALQAETQFLPYEAVLGVSANSSSPIPAVTALMRVIGEEGGELYADIHTTLLSCAQNENIALTSLEQDGVTLYVFEEAGLPIVFARMDNLYAIGTNPDTLRAVIRLNNGADEANFSSSTLYEKANTLGPQENSVGLAIDFAAIAGLVEAFVPMPGEEDAGVTYLFERGLAMLSTLGMYAGQVSAAEDGLASASVFVTNPEGGDPDLLKMINCSSCSVSSPFLAPESANAVSSSYIPVREMITYADSWVRGLGSATGSDMSLKDMVTEFGVDLDTFLLDWVGSEVHSFTLKPYNRDAGDLFYGLPQVSVMPVSSPEAAQTGLSAMGSSIWSLFEMFLLDGRSFDQFSLLMGGGSVAVRPYDYEGTTINRLQYGLNGDLGYAFISNYLVVGTPSTAIEMLIDTYQGSATILEDADYQAARERAPDDLTVFMNSQDQANFKGLATVLKLFMQPIVYSFDTAIRASQFDSFEFYPYSAYLEEDATAVPLALEDGLQSLSIPTNAADEYGSLTYYYELTDLNAGETVTLDLIYEDPDFYPYIKLIDVNDSMYVAESQYTNDGEQLSFTPEEGKTYWLELVGSVYTDSGYFTPYEAYLSEDITIEAITVEGLEVSVTAEDSSDGYLIQYFELTGFSEGDTISARVSGDNLDSYYPYLSLIEKETDLYVAAEVYNDDGSYSVTYTLEADKTYLIEASGSLYGEASTYTLDISVSEAEASANSVQVSVDVSRVMMGSEADVEVALPSYGDLLDMAELIPDFIDLIANRMSTTESYSYIEGNEIVTRSKTFFRW